SGRGADHAARRADRPDAICRSAAAGARSDGHRHQLRHNRAVPGRPDGGARPYRYRSCRRSGAARMISFPVHLVIAPILIPFIAGAIMLLYDDRQRKAKIGLGVVSVVLQIAVAIELVAIAKSSLPVVYHLGDWLAPFGIVLVLDRLSAMMLVLSSVL